MAAGFMRSLAGSRVAVISGGSEPSDEINPTAVVAMAERGIDVALEIPTLWHDDQIRDADVVVTMGCGDTCPVFPGTRYLDWEVDDPQGRDIAEVRFIRDEIEALVQGLLSELVANL
jgi:protein-tyrosine-phosphatase